MSSASDSVYRVSRQDIARAREILTEAFQEDPVWRALFADGATREQRLAAFEVPLIYCRKYGEVWATSPDLEGIAAWVPGRYARMTIGRMVWSGAILAGIKMAKLGQEIEPVFRAVERDRDEHMRGKPYLYLQVLGVAPALQGRGHGGGLLRALIAKSEREGLPLYLETETERNVRMYSRFGFALLKETTLPGIDLPMWEMVRQPGG
jgi:ribosomal protein S18 acetylase RimI-like enzyme